jgi:hypothetical protein
LSRVTVHARTVGTDEERTGLVFVLWLLAVILVIAGIVSLIRGAILVGVLLIVVGLLVGPGGVSVFT